MNMKSILILCLSLLIISVNNLHAEKREFDYKISDGKLYVFEHVIKPEQVIKKSNAEDDTIIVFNQSPDRKWIIIQIGVDHKTEYWVYNTQSKSKPVSINTEAIGKHSKLFLHENNCFVIILGGMGYNTAEFFTHDKKSSFKQIDDLIEYDAQWDIYVSAKFGPEDKIIVGKVFDKTSKQIEKKISLGYEYLSSALNFIKSVQVKKGNVTVQYIDKNNELSNLNINTKNH